MAGEGSVEIGASSRELSGGEMEKHPDLESIVIGIDCIAIAVHPSNPLANMSLTIGQLRDIFLAESQIIKNLADPTDQSSSYRERMAPGRGRCLKALS